MTWPIGSKRVVIATIGSLGDLHPCLALAQELTSRGHRVTIATTPYYRAKVELLGMSFRPIRPNWNPTEPELIRKFADLKRGPEILYREMLLPELRGTYEDLLSVAMNAHVMIAGELVYAAPLIADTRGLPEEIHVDHGPEFICRSVRSWCEEHRVLLRYIEPGRPLQKGYIESFNGRLRDECLNAN